MNNKNKHLSFHEVVQPFRKAAFYARYSTKNQKYTMQEGHVREFLEEYNCILLQNHRYIDEDTSASKIPIENRAEIQKMIIAAKNKEFDFIAVYHSDRIARDTIEHQQFRKLMNDIGMPVVITTSRELYNSVDVITSAVRDGMTRMEIVLLKERTSDTLQSKSKIGVWTGGKAPYGYKYIVGIKKFNNIEREQENVRKIFDWYKLGYGFKEIVERLKEENSMGNIEKWNKDKIKMIITNPFYAGYITTNRFKKNVLTNRKDWIYANNDSINPIITFEEWEYVMQIYEKRKEEQHNPKKYNTPFLLKDIITCLYCNTPLKVKNQSKKSVKKKSGIETTYGSRFYYCAGETCKVKIEAEELHKMFKDEILQKIMINADVKMKDVIKDRLIKEIDDIVKEIEYLKLKTKEVSLKIDQVEKMLIDISNNIEEDIENFIESLTYYQLHKKTENEQMYEQIQLLNQKQIQKTKALEHDEKELGVFDQDSKNIQLRKMVLALVRVIYIDSKNELHAELYS